MSNSSLVSTVSDDEFTSLAQQAALLAAASQAAAEAAQAAAEAALAAFTASLAAQVLDDHADTTITGAAEGDSLVFVGGVWINQGLDIDSLGDVTLSSPAADDILQFDGTVWSNAPLSTTGFLPVSGGTLTGVLELAADPVNPTEAANKSYVDGEITSAGVAITANYEAAIDAIDIPYDISMFFDGIPADGDDIGRFISPRAFTIPVGATGSVAKCQVAPTAAYSLPLSLNGVSIGTLDFALGSTDGVFTIGTLVAVSAGDKLEVVGAATADATIEDLQITIVGDLT